MKELKKNVEALAKEECKSEIEIISMLQSAAHRIGDKNTLEALCEVKWDYIEALAKRGNT